MSKLAMKDIPHRDKLKPVRLKDCYAAGEVGIDVIHAYNSVDAGRKRQFHHDASLFLHSVGAYLGRNGFAQMSCHSNRGGIAVGGEISATYLHPGRHLVLHVTVEADCFWGGSPREDRVLIQAERGMLEDNRASAAPQGQLLSEPGTHRRHKSPRGKGKTPTAYTHIRPVDSPRCYLNPNFDSEVAARCLLLVLERDRATAYWEWLPDASLMTAEQAGAERERRREARKLAKARQVQWEPLVSVQESPACQLRDDYLAAGSSRLLFAVPHLPGASGHGLEQPRLSRGGEEVFLQRDFVRDARTFLHALGCCLLGNGYREMRVMEPERMMLIYGEYRTSGEGDVVRVKLGPVTNTDVLQRHDHLVIAAFTAPAGSSQGERGEQCVQLGVPIKLSAATYAGKLMAALGQRSTVQTAPEPVSSPVPQKKQRKSRTCESAATGDDLVQTRLF